MTVDLPTPATPTRRRWPAPFALAVLLGGLFFLRLGQDVPLRSHEALLASSARNMYLDRPVQLADGSRPSPWLLPNFNDVPRLRKTPLLYWMVAGLAYLTGAVDEWTARLPSALAAVGTVLLVLALVRRWLDRPVAYWAAATLATSVGFMVMARQALADMPMTFFTTASLAAVWLGVEQSGPRRFGWIVLAGAAAGLAMLAKGPTPAVVFPLPYLAAAVLVVARLVRARRAGQPVGAEWAWTLGGAAAASALFLVIVLPWPAYVYLHVPEALKIWKAESVDRSTGDYGHAEPPHFYLTRLPMLLLPWTLFFVCGLILAAQRWRRQTNDRAWLLFVAAWLVGPLAAFSLAAGKQDHYILPAFPAAAVYIALGLRPLLAPAPSRARTVARVLLVSFGVGAILLGLGGVAAYALNPAKPHVPADGGGLAPYLTPAVLRPAAAIGGLAILGGLTVIVMAARRRWRAGLVVAVTTLAAGFLVAWPTLIGPMDRSVTAAEFARYVQQTVPAGVPVYSMDAPNNTVVVYVERPLAALAGPEGVRSELARGHGFFLICNSRQRPFLEDRSGLAPLFHKNNLYKPDEGFWLFHATATNPPK